MKYKKVKLYTDGGAEGNPGPAGIGVVIYNEENNIILKESEFIGIQTNNQAEYCALIWGLILAKDLGVEEVECYSDSELMIKQVQGEYKIKNINIRPLAVIVKKILPKFFKKASFFNIPRGQNKEADKLVQKAISESGL